MVVICKPYIIPAYQRGMSLRHHQIQQYAKEIIENYDITDESTLQQAVHEYTEDLIPDYRYDLLKAFHEIQDQPHVLMIDVKDVIAEGYNTIEGYVRRAVFDEYYGQLCGAVEDLVYGVWEEDE